MSQLIYNEIRKQAIDCGISIKELCEKSGVQYATVMKWKEKNPKTLDYYFKLIKTLENERN